PGQARRPGGAGTAGGSRSRGDLPPARGAGCAARRPPGHHASAAAAPRGRRRRPARRRQRPDRARARVPRPAGPGGGPEPRAPLENASGVTVLLALLVATAQVFTLLTPDSGLFAFVFTAFFALLLWNTLAADPDRPRLLRSLAVVLGGAFLLKFVVLAALYNP